MRTQNGFNEMTSTTDQLKHNKHLDRKRTLTTTAYLQIFFFFSKNIKRICFSFL